MTTGLVFYPRVLAGFRSCTWVAIYLGRVFRILPLIAVSVVVVCVIITSRTGRSFDRGFPSAILMWITSWGEPPIFGYRDSARLNAYVLWSLWYEWLFYLFVLPACALGRDLTRHWLPSWIVPGRAAVRRPRLEGLTLESKMPTFLPLFAIGMLADECRRREGIARLLRTPAAAGLATVALGIGMLAAPDPYGSVLPLFGFFFTCVACGNDLAGLLRTRGALVLGECSYGIYLLHGIVLSLLFVDLGAWTGRLAAAEAPLLLPVVAIVAALVTPLTYLLVERPAIEVGRTLARCWTRVGRVFRISVPVTWDISRREQDRPVPVDLPKRRAS